MSIAVYHPWLFDQRDAWHKTISDSRWSYDMPMSRFMALYGEHRGSGGGVPVFVAPAPVFSTVQSSPVSAPLSPVAQAAPAKAAAPAAAGGPGQILSQNEIDSLLNQLAK